MNIKYFVPALALLVILGQGCLQPKQKNDDADAAPLMSDSDIDEMENGMMQNESAESSEEAMMGGDFMMNDESTATLLYRGSYFDIEYPEGFRASPDGPMDVPADGYARVRTDAAQFESPDGLVSFFVYSPLWAGEPDYLRTASNETVVDERTTESDDGDTITTWATLKANDGSYARSYISIREQMLTGSELHHVFGIKYADAASYDTYRDAFIRFKESLKQYAD